MDSTGRKEGTDATGRKEGSFATGREEGSDATGRKESSDPTGREEGSDATGRKEGSDATGQAVQPRASRAPTPRAAQLWGDAAPPPLHPSPPQLCCSHSKAVLLQGRGSLPLKGMSALVLRYILVFLLWRILRAL